ncbi:hypothetical protein N0V83_000106 [Neocucurbitaria cava]|uniref:J domain-containing protein n=1 Tax=Neocucurbitaria cava TaxID=798079 RepID=A0A9W8YJ82_9PLEO|nr:hypothetical protein N0V83_000106 [Neocucurbitaria cava]
MIITVNRIYDIIVARHGSLDLLHLRPADLVFLQRARQRLLVDQPQQDIVLAPRPQQIVVQQQQPDIVVPPPPEPQKIIVQQQQAPPPIVVQQPQPIIVRQQEPQRIIVQQRQGPQIVYQQQANLIQNPPGPTLSNAEEEEFKRRFEEEERKKREREDTLRRQFEEEEDFRRRHEQEQRLTARNPESSTPIPRTIEPDSDSDSDSDSDEDEKKFDPYEALGLHDRQRTSLDVIRSTYNNLVLIFHPDKQIGKTAQQIKHAAKRMYDINKAKDILLDEERRRAYDEAGAVFEYEFEEWKRMTSKCGGLCGEKIAVANGDLGGAGGGKGKNKYIPA